MSDYDKIRAFEYDILDKHHKAYAFYQYSDDIVIPYLLQIYGDTERHRDNLIRHGRNEINLSFYLNNMLHGIGHCVRWILNKDHTETNNPTGVTYQQIHEMAADFLGWGTGYHMIAQEFVTWSRSIKKAILDEEKKSITFVNPDGFNYNRIYSNQLLYAARLASIYESYPHDKMEEDFTEWIRDINFKKPPIASHVKWERGKTSKSYPILYMRIEKILFPELDESTDFEGYNLKQLRQFYTLVYLTFHFIRWVEAVLDSRSGEDKLSFGSNPLELNQLQFEKLLFEITGLEVNILRAILFDLTFNPANFHASVSIQPFIRTSSGTYYVLPNLFAQLEPSRMILGALNKGSKKKKYDALINTIEKVNLKGIYEKILKIQGVVCYLEKAFKFQRKQFCPDLILIDTAHKFLIVVDYKHFIGPITASEVVYKMKELEKGIDQVRKYVEYLARIPIIGSVDLQGYSVNGLVVTHKVLPIPLPKGNTIPIVDLETFTENIDSIIQRNMSIVELEREIRTNFMKIPTMKLEDFESKIAVRDWVIRRMEYKIH